MSISTADRTAFEGELSNLVTELCELMLPHRNQLEISGFIGVTADSSVKWEFSIYNQIKRKQDDSTKDQATSEAANEVVCKTEPPSEVDLDSSTKGNRTLSKSLTKPKRHTKIEHDSGEKSGDDSSSDFVPDQDDDDSDDVAEDQDVEGDSATVCVKEELPESPTTSQGTEANSPPKKKSFLKRSKLGTKLKKKTPTSPRERTFTCDICNKSFFRRSDLVRHSHSHKDEPFKCDICGKVYRQHAGLYKHRSIHTGERPFTCEICGKTFRTKEVFKVHQRYHRGEKPFACRHCGRHFSQKGHLNSHERIHTGELPYQCEVCGKRFNKGEYVRKHMENIHGDKAKKSFKCRSCELSFETRSKLVNHMLVHWGPKDFKCDQCEKAFYTEYALNEHKSKGHDLPQFICETCGKIYTSRSNLNTHKKTHRKGVKEKPYKCPVCPKSFKIKRYLQTHKVTHTGERPFPCELCGTKLTCFANLQRHYLKIHKQNRTKDWVCKTCGERFLSQWLMKVHNKTHAVGDSQEVAPHVGNGSTAHPSGGNEHYPRGDSRSPGGAADHSNESGMIAEGHLYDTSMIYSFLPPFNPL